LHNIDDILSAFITNSAHTNDLVLSANFTEDTGFVDISSFVTAGSNTLHLELQNFTEGSGYAYGYDFRIDGITFEAATCGIVNVVGCNGGDTTQGLVFSHDIVFSVPSEVPLPAALPLFATGLGFVGLLGWHRKRKSAVAR
jgi:hypothetical protein